MDLAVTTDDREQQVRQLPTESAITANDQEQLPDVQLDVKSSANEMYNQPAPQDEKFISRRRRGSNDKRRASIGHADENRNKESTFETESPKLPRQEASISNAVKTGIYKNV